MKKLIKLFSPIFLNASFARLQRINAKKALRRKRIKEAFDYLNEWHDIPVRELLPSFCDILKIKPNQASLNLIYRMNMDLRDVNDVEKLIPLPL